METIEGWHGLHSGYERAVTLFRCNKDVQYERSRGIASVPDIRCRLIDSGTRKISLDTKLRLDGTSELKIIVGHQSPRERKRM